MPEALSDPGEVTQLLSGNQAQPVDVQWGNQYFHRNARLFLLNETTEAVIPVALDHPPVLIGRNSINYTPSVAFSPLYTEDLGISRAHARLDRNGRSVVIVDLGSTNGTFLDGVLLMPQLSYPLHNRAALQMGKLVLGVQFA
jgi:FHA domain